MSPAHLWGVLFRSVIRQLRYAGWDLAILVAAGGLVFGVTAYIYLDFFGSTLPSISPVGALWARALAVATGVLWLTPISVSSIQKILRGEDPILSITIRFGSRKDVLTARRLLLTWSLLYPLGLFWLVALTQLQPIPGAEGHSPMTWALLALCQSAAIALSSKVLPLRTRSSQLPRHSNRRPLRLVRQRAVAAWVSRQVLRHNPRCRPLIALAGGAVAISGAWIVMDQPQVMSLALLYLGGLAIAGSMALEIADTSAYNWLGTQWGLSPAEVVLPRAAWAMIPCIGAGLVVAVARGANIHHLVASWATLSLWGAFAVPPLLMPFFSFQVDPSQPAIHFALCALISLPVLTAIQIHPLGWMLVPIVALFAQMQQRPFVARSGSKS